MPESRTPTTDRPEAVRDGRPTGSEQQPRFSAIHSSPTDPLPRLSAKHLRGPANEIHQTADPFPLIAARTSPTRAT